nr:PREDICTED: X-ray radiation resistance-associated protein 1 [Paralichthys olivaceus]
MTAASCTLEDGQRHATKCLPARSVLHRRKDGGGHWLVAYRKAEEQSYSHMYRRIKETREGHENIAVTDAPHGHTLDGPFLLRLHCVDKPSELCTVHISEQELDSVKPEDLKMFDNVAYIDASVNLLSLGSFSSFVSLRELNLSVNGIHNMTFDASDFPHLQVLDLSYNSLSADDVVSISRLPRLKVLHLTGNQLHHLPPDLRSTQLFAEEEDDSQFKALEVLMLDDNKLSSGVFNSLRKLKRLKYLNLQGNHISEIPFLQPMGSLEPASISEKEPGNKISQENLEELCKGSNLPLPELQFLNLSHNKIAEEEALMVAAFFPMLREIDIHSNPLTTNRSGDPPLLTYYLQERLGITIKRKETREVLRAPLKVSTDPKWKVEERIPKVSKKRLLMDQETVKKTPECDGKNNEDGPFTENTDNFFVTQAADVSKSDEQETAENEDATVPEKFHHYQRLMDVKPHPGVVEPIGIQTAVRMLEHTLKTLNVYRDSKPKSDSIQMPHRETERKIKDLPPLKPAKQPAERVEDMLKEIRESTTIREFALSEAIHSTRVNRQEQKEVLSLLRDMKTKYKMLHKKSIEQVASVESDRNTDLHEAPPPPGQTF